jgi:hypothetical protein
VFNRKTLPIALVLIPAFHMAAEATERTWDWKYPESFQAYYSKNSTKPVELHLGSPFYTPGNPLFHVAPTHMDMWEMDGWMMI